MCGIEGGRRCPNRSRQMPILKQPEAERLHAPAVSPVQPGRHFSTRQMIEFKTKTKKLGSFRQIDSRSTPDIEAPPNPRFLHRISTVQATVSNAKTAKLGSFRQKAVGGGLSERLAAGEQSAALDSQARQRHYDQRSQGERDDRQYDARVAGAAEPGAQRKHRDSHELRRARLPAARIRGGSRGRRQGSPDPPG